MNRKRVFLPALVVAALAFVPAPARAGIWTAVGPPGGNVRALASDPRDPQRIFLGTADGILYRSDDNGLHWRRLTPGFPKRGCSLDEIVVGARGVVFVGYWEVSGSGGGVARSTDGGRTFTVLKGVDRESVRALALSPKNPHLIAAGTLTGVFLSRDDGQAWKRITPRGNRDLRNIESVAFDPRDPQILYVGTWHLAWKTFDGGATWVQMHRGMIDDSDVMTLTVDRRNPQIVYATACTGIYRSTQGGVEWTKLHGIPYSSRRTRAFSLGGEDRTFLLAGTTEGLWVSENSGGEWQRMTQKELVVNDVLVQRDGAILLGTEEAGILRSSDRGRTWAASNDGFSERFVSQILFDAQGRGLLIAVSGDPRYGGVFASSGVRGPWTHMGEGLEGRQVLSLALLDGTILTGTDDGIFAHAPQANSWNRLPTRLDDGEVHPRVTGLLARAPGRLLAATSKGLIRSTDGGRTWTRPTLGTNGEVSGLAESPNDADRVVAATPNGFFRSDDGGRRWRRVSPRLRGVTLHTFAFMPSDDRVLFATTSGGLFRSDDQAETWRRVAGGIPHSDLAGIAIHPDGRTIYASDFTWGGIFRSVNGGQTWRRMPIDGLASDRVWTLGFDPTAPDQLLAASSAGGLHLLVLPSATTEPTGSLDTAPASRPPSDSR